MDEMLHIDKALRAIPKIDEDEIFKSLTHQVRRTIIKVLGEKELTFTEVKNGIESIDSPSLSYHLKSMKDLLVQKENKYRLSEVGEAALHLLNKTDQSVRISKSKRNFLYAYIITVACWTAAETIVPFILGDTIPYMTAFAVQMVITAISVVNFIVIWQLRKKY